jgi:FHA domain-containing protein
VEPAELVRAARTLVQSVFVDEYGHSPWLAIRIPAGDQEMASALRVGSRIERVTEQPAQPLEFHTDLVALDDLKEMEEPRPPSKRREPNVDALRELIAGRSHFRALRKRLDAAGALGDRVSIGRALNQDIVLRHPRVSKFHGFFLVTKSGDWSVSDAGSTNGTTVNAVRLARRKPVVVMNGDRVTFGSIETAFLDAGTVWRLLRAT